MTADFIIRSRTVVLPGSCMPASLHIHEGKIQKIGQFDDIPPGLRLFDAGDLVVMPGLVDTHVHVNEPGRSEWEGFETATRSAAAGGITTIIDMPLNSKPPTTTVDGLIAKQHAADGECWIDVGFFGGIVPGNSSELQPLHAAGVFGFKFFLCDSGVAEFPMVQPDDLTAALSSIKAFKPLLLAHAEVAEDMQAVTNSGGTYSSYLKSRPAYWETNAAELLAGLCRQFKNPIHIVHVSSASLLPILQQAQTDRLPLSAETCPHYLFFESESISDGATELKCAPPIRDSINREKLWAALDERVIGMIVSDHSPCPASMKRKEAYDFSCAWGGISSLQFSLPAVWTHARDRGCSVLDLADWMVRAPAKLAGLHTKGTFEAGKDADIVCWDPNASFVVTEDRVFHRHKLTPYLGKTLYGVVRQTFLRGKLIYDKGQFASAPSGRLLKRES